MRCATRPPCCGATSRHALRYPLLSISGVMVPVFLLLLFVGVFGNTLRAGLGAAAPAGGRYIDYLAPGILVMTAGADRCGDRDQRLHRHERGHHRPLSHHGDHPNLGAHRPGARQPDPHADQRRPGRRGCHRARLPADGHSARVARRRGPVRTADRSHSPGSTIAFGLQAKTPAGANSLSLIPQLLPFISSAFVPDRRRCPRGCAGSQESALHPDHQHHARASHRDPDRQRG